MTSPYPPASCTWPINRSCFPELPADDDPGYAAALANQLANEDLAVSVLWALTGRQYGVCETTVRPCAEAHQPLEGRWGPIGVFDIGILASLDDFGDLIMERGCRGKCLISSPRAVQLPGPVYQDNSGNFPIVVNIHDYVLDEDEYSVEGDTLFRRYEEWPFQDFSKELGEHGTWSVEYWRGTPPPAGASNFVGALANEFILASSCPGKCRLPKTVTRISRGGVSYDVYNPNNIYGSGKTGLVEIDTWLAAMNPHALMQAPSVI